MSLENILNNLNKLGYSLEAYTPQDEEALYRIFVDIVDSGNLFPFITSSKEDFVKYFVGPQFHAYVCKSKENKIVGGFYVKQNFAGRASHISNAGYMLESSARGKGIGTLLIEASLYIAKNLGFKAMQFNMVLSQNVSANNAYKKVGFEIVGTIPEAVKNPDGSYQDGYVMFRKLDDIERSDIK